MKSLIKHVAAGLAAAAITSTSALAQPKIAALQSFLDAVAAEDQGALE